MNDFEEFNSFRNNNQSRRIQDLSLQQDLLNCQIRLDNYKYGYQFDWLGVPIIRLPDDIVVFQELVWSLKPKVIVEIGVARGGSVILSASLLKLLGDEGVCIGVDIDIREHNREVIESHPIGKDVVLIEGDSLSPSVLRQVAGLTQNLSPKVFVLDGNHTHAQVFAELNSYSKLMNIGDYFYLPDTVIEFFPEGYFANQRPWDKGNNPWTATKEFLLENSNFQVDELLSNKAAISESPGGFIKKIK